jgi:hypothetical protein
VSDPIRDGNAATGVGNGGGREAGRQGSHTKTGFCQRKEAKGSTRLVGGSHA